MNATNAVPVVGTPLAYGLGFLVLLSIVFAPTWAGSLATVAHEAATLLAVLGTGWVALGAVRASAPPWPSRSSG